MTTSTLASANTIKDVATLARALAEREAYKSASGPETLQVLAMHLEEIVASDDGGCRGVVHVEVRKKKSGER